MNKKALIFGITGQDGTFLAELLLDKGYSVYGFARKQSWVNLSDSYTFKKDIYIHYGDLLDSNSIFEVIKNTIPDEIYNLASQSVPSQSWNNAEYTHLINGVAVLKIYEVVRNLCSECKIFHASSSDMYGNATSSPQDESTRFNPNNPYAASKVFAHNISKIFRNKYNLNITTGILFNHESERRQLNFITQKVAYGAACASLGISNSKQLNELNKPIVENGKLAIGDLDISRDWGYAKDYVHAMWLSLQYKISDDYVIGTGISHSIRDLCKTAYDSVCVNWEDVVYTDSSLIRPIESVKTLANPNKASTILNWQPKICFKEMIKKMVNHQINLLKNNCIY